MYTPLQGLTGRAPLLLENGQLLLQTGQKACES
jgi:hypothetical protein